MYAHPNSGMPLRRSQSPPFETGRRPLPIPSGRFDSGGGGGGGGAGPPPTSLHPPAAATPTAAIGTSAIGGQRSPLPFPRIPSPNPQHAPMQVSPSASAAAVSGGGAAAAAGGAGGQQQSMANASQSPARESTRRLSSVVWGPTGFERLESGMSRCRICGKEYSKGSSTGTLKRHFRQHQCNVQPNPYPLRSPPQASLPHASTRPRSYSHRSESRIRREASPPPFAPLRSPIHHMHQQPPPMHLQKAIGAPPPAVPSPSMFNKRDQTEIEASSVMAGSALLSMAAGDHHMVIDTATEAGRRPMRSSDPSVYAQVGDNNMDPETRDISISPSPSSTTSTQHHIHHQPMLSGATQVGEIEPTSTKRSPSDQPLALQHNPQQQQQQQRLYDGTKLPPLLEQVLSAELDSLAPLQLVALSASLVQRVAGALGQQQDQGHQGDHPQLANGDAALGGVLGQFAESLLQRIPHCPTKPHTLPFTLRKQAPITSTASPSEFDKMSGAGLSLLSRVSASMQRIAPLSLAALDWDNVGILLEAAQPRPDAKRVFLTIDLTADTLNEALDDPSVGVIVAYHPPIFSAWKSLSMGNLKQSLVLKCAAHGVSIYSPHTSLDSCSNGVNDWLASLVGGKGAVTPITPASQDASNGQENAGEGRIIELDQPAKLTDIIKSVKAQLGLEHLRVARASVHNNDSKPVSRIAICAGSGSSVLSKAAGADVYFTGEMGHHDVLAAVAKDISCILAEHTNTERGYLQKVLKPRLQDELDADASSDHVDVVVSKNDADPITIE
ncbi:hypothetical protein GGI12_003667 [Dipsacomyces acuminosporus]|nr:hypothetical protein GGI12_003667 [Dipsacomyces acuminosporus]